MSAPTPITLNALLTNVKAEARVDSTDTLDPLITAWINEYIQLNCDQFRYFELYVPFTLVTLVAGQSTYDLPTDFQSIKDVQFSCNQGQSFYGLDVPNDYVAGYVSNGFPKWYRLLNNLQITLWPYSQIDPTQQALQINYYRYHPVLASPTDPILIYKMVPTLQRQLVTRLALHYQNLKAASAMESLTNQSLAITQSKPETQ